MSPESGGAEGTPEADPFAELKAILAFETIRLRVPAIWPSAWDEKAGMWCCCEDLEDPAEDTGTLWIDIGVIELDDGVRSGTPQAERALETMAQGISRRKRQAGETGDCAPEVRDTVWGKAVCYWRRCETEEGRFTEHRWHGLSRVASNLVVTH